MSIEQGEPSIPTGDQPDRDELLRSLELLGIDDPEWLGHRTDYELAVHLEMFGKEIDDYIEQQYREWLVETLAQYGVDTEFTDDLSIEDLEELIEKREDEEEARHEAEELELANEHPENDDDDPDEDPLKGEVDPVGGYYEEPAWGESWI